MKTALTVSIEQLLATTNSFELDMLLKQAADECGYQLDAAWSYWHYGRHAEHAESQEMPALANLFSAAWQINHRVHDQNAEIAVLEIQAIEKDYRRREELDKQLHAVIQFKRDVRFPRFPMQKGERWSFVASGRNKERLQQIQRGERFEFAGGLCLAEDVELIYVGPANLDYSIAAGYIRR